MPVLIPLSNLANLPLVPTEIRDEVLSVLENGSFDDINEVKYFESSFYSKIWVSKFFNASTYPVLLCDM